MPFRKRQLAVRFQYFNSNQTVDPAFFPTNFATASNSTLFVSIPGTRPFVLRLNRSSQAGWFRHRLPGHPYAAFCSAAMDAQDLTIFYIQNFWRPGDRLVPCIVCGLDRDRVDENGLEAMNRLR
jgi:hypothetical protein